MQRSADDQPYSEQLLRAAMLAVAIALLGRAIHVGDGMLGHGRPVSAVYWLMAAIVVIVVAVLSPMPRVGPRAAYQILLAAGIASALANFAQFGSKLAAFYIDVNRFEDYAPFLSGILAAAVLAGIVLAAGGWMRDLALVLLLVVMFALGLWTINKSPAPGIDVFVFQRDSAGALAHGVNPYTITFPDIYGGRAPWYTPEMLKQGRLQFGYQYLPLPLLLALPAQLMGRDFRTAHLAAMILSAAFIALARPGRLSFIAAVLFISTPRTFFVLEQGWTEPLQVMLLALTVLLACRAPRWMPFALGLFLASKQYLPAAAALVPLLISVHGRPQKVRTTFVVLLKALIAAAIVTLPLALWNPRAFWESAIVLHTRFPFRPDALTLLSWWSKSDPTWSGPAWPGFAALAIGVGASLWRAPRGAFGFAAAVAMSFLLFFALGKHAFANYYYFVVGAMCCAIAVTAENPAAARHVSE
jgi:hypothetical protein